MRYRFELVDTRFTNGVHHEEVEADSLTMALFLLGARCGDVEYPEVELP